MSGKSCYDTRKPAQKKIDQFFLSKENDFFHCGRELGQTYRGKRWICSVFFEVIWSLKIDFQAQLMSYSCSLHLEWTRISHRNGCHAPKDTPYSTSNRVTRNSKDTMCFRGARSKKILFDQKNRGLSKYFLYKPRKYRLNDISSKYFDPQIFLCEVRFFFLSKSEGKQRFFSKNRRFFILISRKSSKQCIPNCRNLEYKVVRATCKSLSVQIFLFFYS